MPSSCTTAVPFSLIHSLLHEQPASSGAVNSALRVGAMAAVQSPDKQAKGSYKLLDFKVEWRKQVTEKLSIYLDTLQLLQSSCS